MTKRIWRAITTAAIVFVLAVALFALVGGALNAFGVWPEGPQPIGTCPAAVVGVTDEQ